MAQAFQARPITQVPIAETPPRRSGRRPPASKASLETQIGSLLTFANFFVMSIGPIRNDALDQYEIVALAKALDQQAKTSPRFRRYLEAMLGAGAGASLVGLIVMIGARRAARHGVMPIETDALIGNLIQGSVSGAASNPTTEPKSDASPAAPTGAV
jgi:hypothetical protein